MWKFNFRSGSRTEEPNGDGKRSSEDQQLKFQTKVFLPRKLLHPSTSHLPHLRQLLFRWRVHLISSTFHPPTLPTAVPYIIIPTILSIIPSHSRRHPPQTSTQGVTIIPTPLWKDIRTTPSETYSLILVIIKQFH